jgi:uncharacterized protein YcaQ
MSNSKMTKGAYMTARARRETIHARGECVPRQSAHREPLRLSVAEARGLMLAAQGLLDPLPGAVTENDLHAMIERLGVVQIDTISVVARSQYLVLWSRLGPYDPSLFDALLAPKRAIFEYWAHAASILPMCDFPYYRAEMVYEPEWRLYDGTRQWTDEHSEIIKSTLEAIRERGPLASADFERPAGGRRVERWDWYGPKESRVALDVLWSAGEIMVSGRRAGQKVYDLRERVLADLPGGVPSDEALPGHDERLRYFVRRTLSALGVVTREWLWDYFRLRRYLRGGEHASVGASRSLAVALLKELVAGGNAIPAHIEGIAEPAYVAAERLDDLTRLRAGTLTHRRTTLLSPFDSLVWDRKRAQQLFGYEVVFEAYVVPEKRRYGYYCLTILHCGEMVGRLDAKAVREEGVLLARAVYLEPGVAVDDALLDGLAGALWDLARFLGLAAVRVERTQPAGLARRLSARLKSAPQRVRMPRGTRA